MEAGQSAAAEEQLLYPSVVAPHPNVKPAAAGASRGPCYDRGYLLSVKLSHHPPRTMAKSVGFAAAQALQVLRLLLHGAVQLLALVGVSPETVFGWQLLLLQMLTPAADAGALLVRHIFSTASASQVWSCGNICKAAHPELSNSVI